MAEFIGVVHTIQRICKRVDGRCPVCILGKFACPNNVRFDETDEAAFRELEDVVNKWAEENPEPVYPTWREWLIKLGIVSFDTDFRALLDTRPTTLANTVKAYINEEGSKPIPADIAQKLGIEPKEG